MPPVVEVLIGEIVPCEAVKATGVPSMTIPPAALRTVTRTFTVLPQTAVPGAVVWSVSGSGALVRWIALFEVERIRGAAWGCATADGIPEFCHRTAAMSNRQTATVMERMRR